MIIIYTDGLRKLAGTLELAHISAETLLQFLITTSSLFHLKDDTSLQNIEWSCQG